MKSAKAEGLVLRAAIYKRKSTDDSDKSDGLQSVEIQDESARRFATEMSWAVLDEHVYCDDNISGARVSRPGLDRLMAALGIKEGKRTRRVIDRTSLPFDVLIVRDQSRLIRNSDHSTRLIKQIIRSGVQLWFYKEKRRVQLGFAEELSIGVQGQIDSARRIEASQDAREGLAERAAKGYNTGGVVYGYDNVPVMGAMPSGQPKRLYTDFKINEEQSEVIRGIFRMRSEGYGPRRIAKALNGDPRYAEQLRLYFGGVRPPKPRVGKRGTGSWAPTAVRDLIRNERYIGMISFGRMKNERDEDGEKYRIKQSDSDKIIRTERPDLRIVPQELWDAVQKRNADENQHYIRCTKGLLHGRPQRGMVSKYLLSGLVRCGCCGSSMIVSSFSSGSGRTRRQVRCYLCNYRSHRGPTACSNSYRPPLEVLDNTVLSAIEKQALQPEVIRAAVKRAIGILKARATSKIDRPAQLRRSLAKLEAERDRLVTAIRMGKGALEALVTALGGCEQQIMALNRELQHSAGDSPALSQLEELRLGREFTDRLAHWRDMLAADPPIARDALRALMPEDKPILLIPEQDGYLLQGATRLGALLFDQAALTRAKVASPRGFEPRLPP